MLVYISILQPPLSPTDTTFPIVWHSKKEEEQQLHKVPTLCVNVCFFVCMYKRRFETRMCITAARRWVRGIRVSFLGDGECATC